MDKPLGPFLPKHMQELVPPTMFDLNKIPISYVPAGVLTVYLILSITELFKCLLLNFWATIKIILVFTVSMAAPVLAGRLKTETFKNQFIVFHLLHSLSFNIMIYKLALHKMIVNNGGKMQSMASFYWPFGPETLL